MVVLVEDNRVDFNLVEVGDTYRLRACNYVVQRVDEDDWGNPYKLLIATTCVLCGNMFCRVWHVAHSQHLMPRRCATCTGRRDFGLEDARVGYVFSRPERKGPDRWWTVTAIKKHLRKDNRITELLKVTSPCDCGRHQEVLEHGVWAKKENKIELWVSRFATDGRFQGGKCAQCTYDRRTLQAQKAREALALKLEKERVRKEEEARAEREERRNELLRQNWSWDDVYDPTEEATSVDDDDLSWLEA